MRLGPENCMSSEEEIIGNVFYEVSPAAASYMMANNLFGVEAIAVFLYSESTRKNWG
jgi:hypothetical protein